MWFVGLGVLLSLLKLLDIGPPAVWSWPAVLSPFVLAFVWWLWADWSGYTKRKEMEKMEERKVERRERNMVALGIDPRAHAKRRRGEPSSGGRKVDAQREAVRQKNQDAILNSRLDGDRARPGREPDA